ncbi:MAG TPA: M67 family metallopeptidase [Vicinamibacterales bacterium]|jgi:proteasome lid subunit RPN8/RPN11|nr:M67 family metallopeptidase [Vicinamibacterales bacterium]
MAEFQRVVVTPEVARAIRTHGEATYPHECCGALIGVGERITAAVSLPNTTEEGPRRRFLVRPSDYRMAEAEASVRGADLLGFYHSHPDHPARPSQFDLDHAWPNFAYIIVSVAGSGEIHGGGAATADPSRRSTEGAKAEGAKSGPMTVWFLTEDRSRFDEGELNGDQNPDSNPAQAVHG